MLKLTNTAHTYGVVAVVLHWLVAVVVFALFGTGLYMVDLSYYDELYNSLPAWHKSVGILLGMLMLLRVVWSGLNPAPQRVPGTGAGQWQVARIVHWLMLLLIVAIVITGYLIPTADGSAIAVFDWFSVKAVLHDLENQADVAGELHEVLAYTLVALVCLHALAALKHHFCDRDRTLKRMLGRP